MSITLNGVLPVRADLWPRGDGPEFKAIVRCARCADSSRVGHRSPTLFEMKYTRLVPDQPASLKVHVLGRSRTASRPDPFASWMAQPALNSRAVAVEKPAPTSPNDLATVVCEGCRTVRRVPAGKTFERAMAKAKRGEGVGNLPTFDLFI